MQFQRIPNQFPSGKTALLIALLISFSGLLSQQGTSSLFTPVSPPAKIDQIVILGNKITKGKIIRYQLEVAPGDTVSAADLKNIEDRVYSLNLFNRVDAYLERLKNQVILFVEVTERAYFFPYPYFRLVDKSWKKLNYGLGVAHYNLWGLNQKLLAVGWFGYNPGFSITYRNPWAGKEGWIYGISLLKTRIRNRVYPFSEDHTGGTLLFGKNLNIYSNISLSVTVDEINLTDNAVFYNDLNTGSDTNYKIAMTYIADYRDYHYYPTRGIYARISYYYAFWDNQPRDYHNLAFDLRLYKKISNSGILAFRTLGIKRSSGQPVNDYLLLGYENRLRGYFYEQYHGNWLNITTLSYRFPLLSVKHFTLAPSLYLDESATRNLPFGISMALFAESGFLVNDIFKLGMSDFKSGYGAGLLFHMPYVNILRLDFAVNDNLDNFDIIFQIGVAF